MNQRTQVTQVEKVNMRKFVCEACGNEYTTETPVNDIMEEYEKQYGHSIEETDEEICSVCDDCHEKMKPFLDELAE